MSPLTLADAEQELRAAYLDGTPDRIAAAEAAVDRLDVKTGPVSLHSAALWYAGQGLRVFPIAPLSKIPLIPKSQGGRGCLDGTTGIEQINAWWTRTPEANIGVSTGTIIDVIDVDGPVGIRSWLDMADELPPVFGKVSSPRPGGNHLYVRAVPGRRNKAGILPGVDYRAEGGYVVVPPSVLDARPDQYVGTYRWRVPLNMAALRGERAA